MKGLVAFVGGTKWSKKKYRGTGTKDTEKIMTSVQYVE